jgi:phage baseplate assembly protein W
MLLPEGASISTDTEISEQTTMTSRTYKIDFEKGRIVGMTDGLDAVKQAVHKILLTERFRYLIYDSDYGVELEGLIGKPQAYVKSEIKRRITEALTQDDRIVNVSDFDIRFKEETAYVSFTVVSVFGNFSNEVNINV